MNYELWEPWQIHKLRVWYPKIRLLVQLEPKLGKSLNQIRYKAECLGLKRKVFSTATLTPRNKQWLIKNFHNYTNAQLAEKYHCNICTIRLFFHSIGLRRMDMEYWTREQEKFLAAQFRRHGDKELAIMFNERWEKKKGWSHKHIEKKRKYLGLHRTDEEREKIRQRNIRRGCWLDTTTWITRGEKPEGEIHVQTDSITGYKLTVIKVNGTFRAAARYLYEQNIGPIPEGFVVTFVDGDTTNVELSNLVLMERRHLSTVRGLGGMPYRYKRVKILMQEIQKKANQLSSSK